MKHLEKRLIQKEELDNLNLNGSDLNRTLKSLSFINNIFGTHQQLKIAVLNHIQKHPREKWHIVDLGCGGGDCIFQLNKFLKGHNINVHFTGVDGNSNSLDIAKQKQQNHVAFVQANILSNNFQLPVCDLVISSHFIYHFDDLDAIQFINKAHTPNKPVFIFSELRRHALAYYLFNIIRHILPINAIAKRDGLIAIKRAFNLKEANAIFSNTVYKNFSIEKKPWFRMLIKLY